MNERARKLWETYGNNKNVRTFLNLIGAAEGADYYTDFGGKRLTSLAQHPGNRQAFRDQSGKRLITTASGKYQITQSTFRGIQKQYGLKDFSEQSQDLAAIALLKEKGALDDVVNGRWAEAIRKTNKTWAALPGSPYAQPSVSWRFAGSLLGDSSLAQYDQPAQSQDQQTPQQPIVDPQTNMLTVQQLLEQLGNEGYNVPSMPMPSMDDIGVTDTLSNIQLYQPVAEPTPTTDLLSALGAGVEELPDAEAALDMYRAEMNDLAMDARNDSVARFISGGEQVAPVAMVMPQPLLRELDRIVAEL